MAKVNLVKLEMSSMSVWVKKNEIELFKETFLDDIVVESTVQLDQQPKKFNSAEEHASSLLDGDPGSHSSRGQIYSEQNQKTINIDGIQQIIGGNEQVTDKANSLL
jgi:hypothetical protein